MNFVIVDLITVCLECFGAVHSVSRNALLYSVRADHLSGKPGNVMELIIQMSGKCQEFH